MRWIAWDFDGTLAVREGMWGGALVEVAIKKGIEVDREDLVPHLGSGFPWHSPDVIRKSNESPEAWWFRMVTVFEAAYRKGANLPPRLAAELAARVSDTYRDPTRWRIFDDVHDTLEHLSSEGWRHLILSNHIPELEELVGDLGLAGRFETIISSALTGAEKPHPAAFKSALRHAKPDEEMWMIGDNWAADVQGGLNAGMSAILVRNEHPKSEHSSHGLAGVRRILAARSEPQR